MSEARLAALAVSSCARERETLSIMLDSRLAVTTLPSLESSTGSAEPAVLVLSAEPGSWAQEEIEKALDRWRTTALVFIDAPPALHSRFSSAALASWREPLALPAIVAAAAAQPRRRSETVLSRTLAAADQALRPRFEGALLLAELVQVSRQPESIAIAARFLEQRLLQLLERLAWVDALDAAGDSSTSIDLTAALRRVLSGDDAAVHWSGGGSCGVHASAAYGEALARAVRVLVREAPAGPIGLAAADGEVVATHPHVTSAAAEFAAAAVASLLRRARARFERRGDGFRIAGEGADGSPAA